MTLDNALRVLGLKAGRSEAEVKAAYRHLAMTHHPDRSARSVNGVVEATSEELMKTINLAYELALEDAHSRTPKGRCARCKGKRKVKVGNGLVTMTIACPDCSTVK